MPLRTKLAAIRASESKSGRIDLTYDKQFPHILNVDRCIVGEIDGACRIPRPDLVFEESPQHTYPFKRLSVAAPKYGPTLKISPSAERYIMGNEEDLFAQQNEKRRA